MNGLFMPNSRYRKTQSFRILNIIPVITAEFKNELLSLMLVALQRES